MSLELNGEEEGGGRGGSKAGIFNTVLAVEIYDVRPLLLLRRRGIKKRMGIGNPYLQFVREPLVENIFLDPGFDVIRIFHVRTIGISVHFLLLEEADGGMRVEEGLLDLQIRFLDGVHGANEAQVDQCEVGRESDFCFGLGFLAHIIHELLVSKATIRAPDNTSSFVSKIIKIIIFFSQFSQFPSLLVK